MRTAAERKRRGLFNNRYNKKGRPKAAPNR